jgi:hypothetical protein
MESQDATIARDRGAARVRGPRRVFLENREIPRLVRGTAVGDPVACRRVLGARRGGRVGAVLALGGLALAAPTLRAAAIAAFVHVALGLLVGLRARRRTGQRTREVQRLALWTVLTPLGVAVLSRPLGFGSEQILVAAAIVGQLLLLRALRATRER